ncbi:hypothetical protein NDU88_007777 [Pleurodeles waltl]|uniref:Uncharacterized protein n=1 Tax=Pleurodeles waltl TaxID=8319 RepID=A0AAV7RR97_PLEWA|nr:hypothetical protein NDU88_007777 [Pleurodeles waltl]
MAPPLVSAQRCSRLAEKCSLSPRSYRGNHHCHPQSVPVTSPGEEAAAIIALMTGVNPATSPILKSLEQIVFSASREKLPVIVRGSAKVYTFLKGAGKYFTMALL